MRNNPNLAIALLRCRSFGACQGSFAEEFAAFREVYEHLPPLVRPEAWDWFGMPKTIPLEEEE